MGGDLAEISKLSIDSIVKQHWKSSIENHIYLIKHTLFPKYYQDKGEEGDVQLSQNDQTMNAQFGREGQ